VYKILNHALIVYFIFSLCHTSVYSDTIPNDKLKYIINHSTITRVQKPLEVRTDKETLEYFIEHVEELTKYGKDFNKKELLLEVKGNSRYGITMPSKKVTGEFTIAEKQPGKVTYLGHGNASVFFRFSGTIVLETCYSTKKDATGYYEEVKTTVYLKFDNAILAIFAKAASPIINPKLDKLISKLAAKTKNVVENAYSNKYLKK